MIPRSSLRPYPLSPCPCPADDDSPSKSPVSDLSESQIAICGTLPTSTPGACVGPRLFHKPKRTVRCGEQVQPQPFLISIQVSARR